MSNIGRRQGMNRSIYTAVLLLAVFMLALSGCTAVGEGTTESAAPAGEVVVIEYPTFQIGVNTAAGVVAQLVDDFNTEYAGQYQIEVEEIPGDSNYFDKMQVLIASGTVPPVIYGGGQYLLDMALADRSRCGHNRGGKCRS